MPHAISVPDTSLWDNLNISAQRYPNKTALIFLGQCLSYSALLAQTLKLAAHLQQLGVKQGDRVILNMQNCPQWVIAHFAVLRANAVVVPVNPMNRAEELKHYITDSEARVAITSADLAAELAHASNQLPCAQRLAHVVVTHFADAFDTQVSKASAWLVVHPAPAARIGRRRSPHLARRTRLRPPIGALAGRTR